jgi:hypothetical protein
MLSSTGVGLAGSGVSVGGTAVGLGGAAVSVAGAAVGLGGIAVSVAGGDVGRGGKGVVVGGNCTVCVGSTTAGTWLQAFTDHPDTTRTIKYIVVLTIRGTIECSI